SELRTYQFQNISNFRDVACSINESSKEIHIDPAKRVHLKPRMLFRSAKPDYASDEDLIRITKKIGIRTILDLRSEVEGDDQQTPWFNSFPLATATVLGGPLVDAPSIKNYSSASDLLEPPPPPIPPRPSSSSSSYSAPWETKRGSYGSDSLTLTSSGGDVESDAESIKLAYYQLRGMKQQMLDTVGKDIFKNIGLQGFYAGLLCYSGKEIARAIKIFSNLDNYPILVHCSHGKDRTGIIIALLLSLLGVDDRLIVDDYAKTREGMKDKLDEVKSDMRGTGMPDSFADAPPEAMRETMKHLRRIYRSTSYYLELIGISQRRQQRI
ncbi:protein-tyrosine phosphatase-like protein, partial [Dimargaris cristalligena]